MGCTGPFFICGAEMRGGLDALEKLLTQTLSGLGYELADFHLSNRNKQFQIFIDKRHEQGVPNGGITLEDCQRASQQLQRVLEVEGIDYDRLEVSSPGLDRRLKKPADFVRFRGHEAEVRLRVPVNGRRRLVGTVGELAGEVLQMDVDGVRFEADLGNIERARLVPKI
jgi:ribosome maturation factor RimP